MAQVFEDVACMVCGCLCDDIALHVENGRVAAAEHACSLSKPWLLEQSASTEKGAKIVGQEASFEDAVKHATEVLKSSRAPLVYGLCDCSTAGLRAACHLADQMGATLDTTASVGRVSSAIAQQAVGTSTSTLGEVRHRSDVVVYWGSNPMASHPRHFERFVDLPGMFVPGGRSDRQVVVVDVQRTATAEIADRFVQVDPGSDFEILWALRAAIQGVVFHEKSIGGVPREELLSLAECLKAGQYTALFYGDGLTQRGVPQATVEALLRLGTDLNAHTRCVVRRMSDFGNAVGAENVLCWQTGFPNSVSLSRGYPRYNPSEYTANNLIEQGEVDAVVIVGSKAICKLSVAAQKQLTNIPVILLDAHSAECNIEPAVQFATAIDGVHRKGTAYRMDGVPIPLQAVLECPLPSDEEVLTAIARSFDTLEE